MGGGSLEARGFTLVEILAVIIILAVITLITVPIVTNAVKSARKGSFKVSAQNIVKAADKYYGEHEFEMNKVSTFDFSKNDGKNEAGEELLVSGKKPISGKVVVSKQGDIVLADISDGTYYANYDSTIDDQVVITETSEVLTRDELTQQLQDLQKLVKKQQEQIDQTNKDLTATTATANSANSLATTLNSTRLNKTYPVGSIYISYSNTNPGSLFGGTWESYGTGKTLVGVDSSQTNFNTVGKTGGANTVTLSIANLPSHTHSIPALSGKTSSDGAHSHQSPLQTNDTSASKIDTPAIGQSSWIGNGEKYAWMDSTVLSVGGNHTHTVTTNASATGASGSGTAVNNLQPYITVYMWRRVS